MSTSTNIGTGVDTKIASDGSAWPPDWAPPHLVSLVETLQLSHEAVDWRAEAFDSGEPVDGADAVAFLAEWRPRMRAALAAYDASTGGADG